MIPRRSFLLGLGSAGAAAISSSQAGAAPAPETHYKPAYFTDEEWAFLVAAVDRLIPAGDNGPGGVEAGVPVFIDRQMEAPYGHGAYWYMQGPFQPDAPPTLGYQLRYSPRELYRLGIAAAAKAFETSAGHSFAQASASARDDFLHRLETGAVQLDGPPAQIFFNQLLTNVREGYFADPLYGGNKGMAAWKAIGFPGARADFTDWMDQQGKAYPYGPVSIEGRRG